jgi:ParB family transcriptional regulator, chromosome partitioning protein
MNRIVLGRGLGALIPDGTSVASMPQAAYSEIPVDKITPNPDQPRTQIDPASIVELSESIRRDGVLQPIIVHPRGAGFELVAGERRLRAAVMAGLTTIPARVLGDIDDQRRAVLALVENLQREDLNPIEEATGLHELQTTYALTQEEVAQAVGKDRSTVANTIRILQLPTSVRQAIAAGRLTAGHGRALLSLSDTAAIERTANLAIKENWSVRQLERELSDERPARKGRPMKAARSHRYTAVEDALKRKFGTQVLISHRLGKGKVIFEYYSEEDLTRLIDLFEVRLD